MRGGSGGRGGGLAGAVRALEEAASIGGGECAASPESMDAAGIAGAYCAAVALRAHMGAAELAAGADSARGGAVSARAAEAMAAFDSSFHPRAVERLGGLADEIARRLESGAGAGDPAEYDRLREAMSAAEFARQYGAGLRGA